MESQSEKGRQPRRALRIHPNDNIAVALEDIPAGSSVMVAGSNQAMISIGKPIPFAHKIALRAIDEGGSVYKYGFPIAVATQAINPGEWVHEHNARSRIGMDFTEAGS